MGRIKSKLVKRTTRAIVAREKNLATNFEGNKKILGKVIPSKKIRNQVAGYITRVKKKGN